MGSSSRGSVGGIAAAPGGPSSPDGFPSSLLIPIASGHLSNRPTASPPKSVGAGYIRGVHSSESATWGLQHCLGRQRSLSFPFVGRRSGPWFRPVAVEHPWSGGGPDGRPGHPDLPRILVPFPTFGEPDRGPEPLIPLQSRLQLATQASASHWTHSLVSAPHSQTESRGQPWRQDDPFQGESNLVS